MTNLRIGHGYDVHRLVPMRKLILGGVDIPYHLGLDGHSDADVLIHAIMDALLGAAAMRDIGKLFPDNDPKFKNIDSMLLLTSVKETLYNAGYNVVNIDCTVICQKPKLSPHIPQMQQNIARVLAINCDQVNIKATTEEGLGFTGNGDGISAHAVVLIEKTNEI